MLKKFLSFTGIDNQHPTTELEPDPKTGAAALLQAMNVDITLMGRLRRRAGFARTDSSRWRNLWQASGFKLATKNGDLVNADSGDVLYETLSGTPRTWYTNLPDGRSTFSNGLICGVTDGTTSGTTKWGVPLPAGVGAVTPTAGGSLFPGLYKYAVTHVRTADGLEGGPTYAGSFTLAAGEGTVVWTGLPDPPAGHTTNVYLTSHNDDVLYLAASTSNTAASFSAANDQLQLALKTEAREGSVHTPFYPAPAGILTAFWRGRMLMASGNLLIASRPYQYELFDLSRDFKAFGADLTLVQPVDGGIWVGTQNELNFLAGKNFDELELKPSVMKGPVALGSGLDVDAQYIKGDENGNAMMCIANGYVCAGFSDGTLRALSYPNYRTDADEVVAAFRLNGEIPQYIAIAQ